MVKIAANFCLCFSLIFSDRGWVWETGLRAFPMFPVDKTKPKENSGIRAETSRSLIPGERKRINRLLRFHLVLITLFPSSSTPPSSPPSAPRRPLTVSLRVSLALCTDYRYVTFLARERDNVPLMPRRPWEAGKRYLRARFEASRWHSSHAHAPHFSPSSETPNTRVTRLQLDCYQRTSVNGNLRSLSGDYSVSRYRFVTTQVTWWVSNILFTSLTSSPAICKSHAWIFSVPESLSNPTRRFASDE